MIILKRYYAGKKYDQRTRRENPCYRTLDRLADAARKGLKKNRKFAEITSARLNSDCKKLRERKRDIHAATASPEGQRKIQQIADAEAALALSYLTASDRDVNAKLNQALLAEKSINGYMGLFEQLEPKMTKEQLEKMLRKQPKLDPFIADLKKQNVLVIGRKAVPKQISAASHSTIAGATGSQAAGPAMTSGKFGAPGSAASAPIPKQPYKSGESQMHMPDAMTSLDFSAIRSKRSNAVRAESGGSADNASGSEIVQNRSDRNDTGTRAEQIASTSIATPIERSTATQQNALFSGVRATIRKHMR